MDEFSPIKPLNDIKRNLTEEFSDSDSNSNSAHERNLSLPEDSRRGNSELTFGIEDVTPASNKLMPKTVSNFTNFYKRFDQKSPVMILK